MATFPALRGALEEDTEPLPEDLGPIESWSDDLLVTAAGQGRPEAVAERERRTRDILGPSSAAPVATPRSVAPSSDIKTPIPTRIASIKADRPQAEVKVVRPTVSPAAVGPAQDPLDLLNPYDPRNM